MTWYQLRIMEIENIQKQLVFNQPLLMAIIQPTNEESIAEWIFALSKMFSYWFKHNTSGDDRIELCFRYEAQKLSFLSSLFVALRLNKKRWIVKLHFKSSMRYFNWFLVLSNEYCKLNINQNFSCIIGKNKYIIDRNLGFLYTKLIRKLNVNQVSRCQIRLWRDWVMFFLTLCWKFFLIETNVMGPIFWSVCQIFVRWIERFD